MEPNRREFQKQCAFQSFCKRVLHNEACNAHDEIRRRRKREVSFCDLALHEERQLYTVDKYFQDEEAEPRYQMAGKEITRNCCLKQSALCRRKKDCYPAVLFRGHDRRGNRKDVQYVAQHDTVQTDKLF